MTELLTTNDTNNLQKSITDSNCNGSTTTTTKISSWRSPLLDLTWIQDNRQEERKELKSTATTTGKEASSSSSSSSSSSLLLVGAEDGAEKFCDPLLLLPPPLLPLPPSTQLQHSSNNNDNNNNNRWTATIPESGWYGLYFTTHPPQQLNDDQHCNDSNQNNNNNNNNIHKATTPAAAASVTVTAINDSYSNDDDDDDDERNQRREVKAGHSSSYYSLTNGKNSNEIQSSTTTKRMTMAKKETSSSLLLQEAWDFYLLLYTQNNTTTTTTEIKNNCTTRCGSFDVHKYTANDNDRRLQPQPQPQQSPKQQLQLQLQPIKLDMLRDNKGKNNNAKFSKEYEQEEATLALNVGRLFYLPAKSRIAILCQRRGETTTTTTTTTTKTETEPLQHQQQQQGSMSQIVALKFCLCYRHSTSQEIQQEILLKNNNDNNGNNAAAAAAAASAAVEEPTLTMKPGDVAYNCKKPIMCGSCWKRFPKTKPALDHWKQKHNNSNKNKNRPRPPKEADRSTAAAAAGKGEEEGKDCYHNCSTNFPKSLKVVYQDNSMAVIDKPQGVAVQGDKSSSLLRSDLLLSLAVPVQENNNNKSRKKNKKKNKKKRNNSSEDDNDNNKNNIGTTGQEDGSDDSNNGLPPPSSTPQYLRKPTPVHRLDAGTGGLLVVAKTREAESYLKGCFAKRLCKKRYRAILLGKLEPRTGTVDHTIADQPAKTRYDVVDYHPSHYSRDGWITSVDLFPETGRRHQLRKHMKILGHPIIGDRRYNGFIQLPVVVMEGNNTAGDGEDGSNNPPSSSVMSRLCLWATELTLPHPLTKKDVTFVIDEPEWFHRVIQKSSPVAVENS